MTSRIRTTDQYGSLNKLKVKSLKCLKKQIESTNDLIAGQASYFVLMLLKEYE